MEIVSAIVVFSLSWWFSLFIYLPIGIEVPEEQESGHASSAPKQAMIWKKMLWSTITAILVTVIFISIIIYGDISLEAWLGITDWDAKISAGRA